MGWEDILGLAVSAGLLGYLFGKDTSTGAGR